MKKLASIFVATMLMIVMTALPVCACTPKLTPPKMPDSYYDALDSAYEAGQNAVKNGIVIKDNNKTDESANKSVESGNKTDEVVEETKNSGNTYDRWSQFRSYYQKWFGYFR